MHKLYLLKEIQEYIHKKLIYDKTAKSQRESVHLFHQFNRPSPPYPKKFPAKTKMDSAAHISPNTLRSPSLTHRKTTSKTRPQCVGNSSRTKGDPNQPYIIVLIPWSITEFRQASSVTIVIEVISFHLLSLLVHVNVRSLAAISRFASNVNLFT